MDRLRRVMLMLPESLWQHLAIVAASNGMGRAEFIRHKLQVACAGRFMSAPGAPVVRKVGRPKKGAAAPVPALLVPTTAPIPVAASVPATDPVIEDLPIIGDGPSDDEIVEASDGVWVPRSKLAAHEVGVAEFNAILSAVVPAPVPVNAPAAGVPRRTPSEVIKAHLAPKADALGPVRIIEGTEYPPLPDPMWVELYGEEGAYVRYNAALVDDGWDPISIDEFQADIASQGVI